MKRNILVLLLPLIMVFAACEGPQGLPGFDGLDGLDGEIAQVIEFDGIDFEFVPEDNIWRLPTPIDFAEEAGITIFESTSVLVFLFDGTVPLTDGTDADSFSPLPQNFFVDQGTIQYVFSHTFVDLELFIDGNFDLANLDPSFTEGLTFRLVFVPGEFAVDSDVDVTNLSAVMNSLGLEDSNIQRVDSN